jgi:hypothetical protein
MPKDDLIGLASTNSTIITMSEPQRQEHLASIYRFLEVQRRPERGGMIEVPMACLCWRKSRR